MSLWWFIGALWVSSNKCFVYLMVAWELQTENDDCLNFQEKRKEKRKKINKRVAKTESSNKSEPREVAYLPNQRRPQNG